MIRNHEETGGWNGMHLLIVDDNPVMLQTFRSMAQAFTPAFSKISTARSSMEAWASIRSKEPDMVITEIHMPDMNGLRLCQAVHEQYPHIPIAVISESGKFEDARQCMNSGVKHYLVKPVTDEDMHEVLRRLVKHAAQGYLSFNRCLEWMDSIERCVWTLQLEELEEQLKKGRAFCRSAGLTLSQVKELLGDCASLLQKRFQARSFPAEFTRGEHPVSTISEALDCFEKQIRQIADELLIARNGNYKDPMEEAKTYIERRLSQDITLDHVAAMVGLTSTYFSSLFKQKTNESFVQYRTNRRMKKAKELLCLPHFRIADVAAEVGYDDYQHFTKTFKKIVGFTPSEFRGQLGIK